MDVRGFAQGQVIIQCQIQTFQHSISTLFTLTYYPLTCSSTKLNTWSLFSLKFIVQCYNFCVLWSECKANSPLNHLCIQPTWLHTNYNQGWLRQRVCVWGWWEWGGGHKEEQGQVEALESRTGAKEDTWILNKGPHQTSNLPVFPKQGTFSEFWFLDPLKDLNRIWIWIGPTNLHL